MTLPNCDVRFTPNSDRESEIPQSAMSALPPCVDGAELARAFFTFAALVGAAMCSAFECGTQGRWP
jgi:hypothetical protein